MLNNYFKPSVSRPTAYSPYYANKPISEHAIKANNSHKYRKYKLIILLIAKLQKRMFKDVWEQLWDHQRKIDQNIQRLVILTDKNINHSLLMAFQRLKRNTTEHRINQKLVKSMVNLLQRIEKYKLKQCFSRLILNSARQNTTFINTFLDRRDYQFSRKLQGLFKKKKKESLTAIRKYAEFVKSFNKVRVIAVIYNRFQKQLKHTVFAKLARFLISKNSQTGVNHEMQDLKTQLQDMNVQLQNKNENIQRLQDELTQIKVEQSISYQHNLSYGEQPSPRKQQQQQRPGSLKSFSLKKLASGTSMNKLSHNQSGQNLSIHDMSIGSLLGNLNKSRVGSISKLDASCDCNCHFKSKYIKYKSLNESLKNQLQIVKEELQVAKDLNQHFTNEIKTYLTGENNQGQFEKLKNEHKILLDERDQLREKVFKYQKHISNLKAEFKIKMQELYRKVRKDM